MKRLLYLLMAALLMVLAVSCKKDEQNNNDNKIPVPEAIDLGITVGGKTVKWASFNIGASKPWEYGNYYAWGECEPKAKYNIANYLYASGSLDKLIAYCPLGKTDYWDSDVKPGLPDGETKLLPSDDAAHVHLGGKWRMPTVDELQALLELKNDTDNYEWVSWDLALDENGNEVRDAYGNVIHGLRITQKSTGNSVFFPAAGTYLVHTDPNSGDVVSEGFEDVGLDGYYWSSSLYTAIPSRAWFFYFAIDGVVNKHETGRHTGKSIRPVCEE